MLTVQLSRYDIFIARILAVVLLLAAIIFAEVGTSEAAEKTVLQLAWKHQFQFAGYYAALHKGYYREAGLDVTIIEGGQGKFAREEVLSGRAQYGVAGAELLLHRRDGNPFVVLAPIFQHSPSILLARRDAGIATIQDLVGKRVMLLPGKKDADILAAFLNEGVPLDAFHRLDQTYDLDDLIQGRTDAVSAYVTNEPWQLLQQGIEPAVISPRTSGVDFYSDCLFTTEAEIRKHPRQVQAFLDASLRGWEYAMAHTPEIIDQLITEYGVKKHPDHLYYEAEAIQKMMLPDLVQIGHMNPGRWRHIAGVYRKLGLLNADFSQDGFLYDPGSQQAFSWVNRTFFAALFVILMLVIGAGFLVAINRRLRSEMQERRQAEQALIKKEALFRGLFDHMTSGSAVYEVRNDGSKGTDYIIREFNRKSLELEGKNLDEVLGKSLFDLRPNIDDYGLIPVMKKVWETGIPAFFSARLYHDDTFSNYYENHIFKLPSGEVVTIYNDVTDQKIQERDLRESEQKYRVLFDTVPLGITVSDQFGNIVESNAVSEKFLGTPETEHETRTVEEPKWQIIRPDGTPMPAAEYAGVRALKEKRPIENVEMGMMKSDTEITWMNVSAAPLDLEKYGAVVTYVDITERKRADAEKEKLQTQLLQAQKMESVGRLAGGVAHDFNNMLGVILGHSELALLQANETHDLHSDLQEIQKAAKRSADITKQLLAFARKQTISPRTLDLNDTVESMLKMLRRLIGEDIDLKWQAAAHIWPVKMDPTQIDQILANLCINARDAISGVGKITIETGIHTFDDEYCSDHPGCIPGDFVLLKVSDNGCGMDKDTLDNLFEPFFTTKEVGKGTGLGLATVYGIVKQNNGFINVYSEPGQGAVFKIYLPRFLTDEETETAVPGKKSAAGGTETILLVEDEPSILRMTRMMLERKEYTVLSAATPAEAMEKAKNWSGAIDLLITDVVMPEMNGQDLAKKITDLYPDILCLYMSGYTAEIIAHHGVLDAGVAFIQKPFSMAAMTEKIRAVLDGMAEAETKMSKEPTG